jgi:multiple sugar transport system permease protein
VDASRPAPIVSDELAATVSRATVRPGTRRRGPLRSESKWGVLYALPAVAVIGVFVVYPFVSIIVHAFTRWDGYSDPVFIGLRNFQFLVQDQTFLGALRNNIFFALSVPIQLTLPLGLAFLIHQGLPGWRFYRWTYFFPAIYSTIVLGVLARLVFQVNGPLNEGLGAIGLSPMARDWLGDASTALPAILMVFVWANFGYNVVLYLAGMSAIDPQLPEAARIDGANQYQVLRHVYVPGLRRVMEIVLVTSTINAFAYMFTYVYAITNGGPGYSTFVVEFDMYNNAFAFQRLGYACAMGLFLTLLISGLGFLQIRTLTRGAE